MEFELKYDLRAPAFGAPAADLYAAALDQCAWADQLGFRRVKFLEHHGSDDGYLPSPMIACAAVAARSSRLLLRIQALILPLHDPIRVAEDLAVVDVISRGRLELVVAGGYLVEEYRMFGRELAERPGLVERGVAALKQAWIGEPFVYDGRPAHVALRPHRNPRPPILLGGSSKAAARRAARIADGYQPGPPELVAVYAAECEKLGNPIGLLPKPGPPTPFIHLTHDVEAAWQTLGPHLLHESNSYARWIAEAGINTAFRHADTVAQLRAQGAHGIMTPGQLLDVARRLGPEGRIEFHPLVGGLDPAVGWDSLRLFEREVLPVLRAEGLADEPTSPRP